MAWRILPFGKYKGKTLPQIVFADPDWFFWVVAVGFKSGALAVEAEKIRHRATHIRIPGKQSLNSKVEYVFDPIDRKLADVKVVPESQPLHEGASPTHRSDYFDLFMPRRFHAYDKFGGYIVVHAIKYYYFGNAKTRLTRARCEGFFDDDKNFA